MNYVVRLANEADIANLAILKQKVWDETYRGIYNDEIIDDFDYKKAEETFSSILKNDKISLYVVESNGELVGYMDVGVPIREFADYEQEIGLLYLRKDFQGKKIGTELFKLGHDEIKNNGYNRFFISCNKYNMKARSFYEKMGGKLVAEDDDREDKRSVQVKYHYDIK